MNTKVLIIDNYDSFTNNLLPLLYRHGAQVQIIKNDEMSAEACCRYFQAHDFTHLILSPGPGHPLESGISREVLAELAPAKVPIMGVCLGHQLIALHFGGLITKAEEPKHGKLSEIEHEGRGLFHGLPKKIRVIRYHSLIAHLAEPGPLVPLAWSYKMDGRRELMAFSHQFLPCFGVQFHPESVLTEGGALIMKNFLFGIGEKFDSLKIGER